MSTQVIPVLICVQIICNPAPEAGAGTAGAASASSVGIPYVNESGNIDLLMKEYGVNIGRASVVPVKSHGKNQISAVKKPRGCNSAASGCLSPAASRPSSAIPAFLERRVSLAGNGSVKAALMLLSHETGAPVVIYRGFPDNLKNAAYYKNVPLYKVLNGLIVSNGFKYEYKNGIVSVYAVEDKTFHIPVSDLMSSFSSTVGMGAANGQNAGAGGYGASDSGGGQSQNSSPAAGSIASGASQTSAESNQNSGYGAASNPSGSLSLTLSESDSLYAVISGNIKEMLTKKGRYFINPKDGLIWVKDRISNVAAVAAYIKSVDKFLSKQVFLKVEVIDVALNKGFQTGIDWNLLFNQAFKSNAFGADALSFSAALASNNNISGTPYIGFNSLSGGSSAVLDALKTQGTVNIISQPRLLLMDGQTRLISSGTITPYVSSVQTMALSLSQTETYPVISQAQTGLSISFTPHIDFKNNSVSVTVSLIDNSITGYQSFSIGGYSFSNPVIESKSFSDTVDVKSGATILVGGLLTSDRTENNYGIPLLSEIPLIGNIFKSVNNASGKEDLIIMLTPEITS